MRKSSFTVHFFFFSLCVPPGLRDLSSPTRDQTQARAVKAWKRQILTSGPPWNFLELTFQVVRSWELLDFHRPSWRFCMWIRRINKWGLACSSLQERPWKMLIAFGNDRRVIKPGTETHCDISTSLDSQESSEANTVRDGCHHSGTDGDESGDDPPEEKRSKLKRRQVTHHLSLQHTPARFRNSGAYCRRAHLYLLFLNSTCSC